MQWSGINRKVTDIGAPGGMGYYMANPRLRQAGEAQRRYGLAKGDIAQAGTPIIGIATTYTPNGPILTQVQNDGGVNGFGFGGGGGGLPGPLWGDPPRLPPHGASNLASCVPLTGFTTVFNGSPFVDPLLAVDDGGPLNTITCSRRLTITIEIQPPYDQTFEYNLTFYFGMFAGLDKIPDWYCEEDLGININTPTAGPFQGDQTFHLIASPPSWSNVTPAAASGFGCSLQTGYVSQTDGVQVTVTLA